MQEISISYDKKIRNVTVDSSFHFAGNRNSFFVVRRRNPIKLNVEIDSVKKTIYIKSRNSLEYWSNLYFNCGIGMLIEKDEPKRYSYPSRIYLEYKDTNIIVNHYPPTRKGTFNWHLAFPTVNFIHLKTIRNYESNAGALGLESGFDYFYKDNRYLSVYAGIAGDYSIPDKVNRIEGEFQTSTTTFINVRNNYDIGCFNWGYGLNISNLVWQNIFFNRTSNYRIIKDNICLGFSFIASYRFGDVFQIGLLYQPDFLNLMVHPEIDYQHYITIELAWKIHLKKVLSKQIF